MGYAAISSLIGLLLWLAVVNAGRRGFESAGVGSSVGKTASPVAPVQTGSLDDVFGASYDSVEDATLPVLLFEYVPSPLTPSPVAEAFIGAEELHMSHVACAGQFRWNKTCVFRNLYMDARPTSNARSWLFFASYSADSSDAERRALLAQLNLDVRVELNPFLRWEGETSEMGVSWGWRHVS